MESLVTCVLGQDTESLVDSMGVCVNGIQSPLKKWVNKASSKKVSLSRKVQIYLYAKTKKYYIVKQKNLYHCILTESVLLHEHLAITVKGVPVEYKIFSWK